MIEIRCEFPVHISAHFQTYRISDWLGEHNLWKSQCAFIELFILCFVYLCKNGRSPPNFEPKIYSTFSRHTKLLHWTLCPFCCSDFGWVSGVDGSFSVVGVLKGHTLTLVCLLTSGPKSPVMIKYWFWAYRVTNINSYRHCNPNSNSDAYNNWTYNFFSGQIAECIYVFCHCVEIRVAAPKKQIKNFQARWKTRWMQYTM